MRATLDAWFVRGDRKNTLVLTNFALPRHPIVAEEVAFTLTAALPPAKVTIQRIDLDHANAKQHWEQQGKPEYLSGTAVAELKAASLLKEEPLEFLHRDGALTLKLSMPQQSVASIQFCY